MNESSPNTSRKSRLRDAGLRATTAREEVLAALDELDRPATHGELARLPRLAGMDRVTLYRTLTTFLEAGFVHQVLGEDGSCRYCPQPAPQPGCPGNHVHLLCTRCGTMQCLADQPMPRVVVPAGFVVEGRSFLARGICGSCSERESGTARR